MEHKYELFLDAMQAAVANTTVSWTELTPDELTEVLQLSAVQFVQPMVYAAVCRCPAVKALPVGILQAAKKQAMMAVMLQTQKTSAFLNLYSKMQEAGLSPLVVKGLICRTLYPSPDSRCSSDEDILIPPEKWPEYHQFMLAHGMALAEPDQKPEEQYEVPYYMPTQSAFLIEMHKHLFAPGVDAVEQLNRYFEDAADRSVMIEVEGVPVRTMCPTDHLLYLVLHAYKHFLHSGFGLRQLCDICMFACRWGGELHWLQLVENFRELKLTRFVCALLHIGEAYLGFDLRLAKLPEDLQPDSVPVEDLLLDLLGAGVYGNSSMSRKHSSNITLDAIDADRTGRKRAGVMKSLFPSANDLKGRYPYLEKHPGLLPVAWCSRILQYHKETGVAGEGNSASESIRIGKERIALLREYGIID